MRIVISFLISLFLVGLSYLLFGHYFNRADQVEIVSGAAPTSPSTSPTPPAPTPPPANTDSPVTPKAEPAPAPGTPQAIWSGIEKRILELTNAARAAAKLNPLEAEDGLRKCALTQSADMLSRGFFDHVNPSGEDPADRMARLHRQLIGTAGENIWRATGDAYTTRADLADVIMDGWMHSPGHRANILAPQFTHLGVGVVMRGDQVMATQSFSHVRAYLNVPLSETVTPGAAVDLSTHGEPPLATLYLLDPVGDKRGSTAAEKPLPVAGASLSGPPGRYVVQFYFAGQKPNYSVFRGPSITIGQR